MTRKEALKVKAGDWVMLKSAWFGPDSDRKEKMQVAEVNKRSSCQSGVLLRVYFDEARDWKWLDASWFDLDITSS